MPKGNKKEPIKKQSADIHKASREQRKALRETEAQFNPPMLEVDIKTGEVKWYRPLFQD